MPVVSSVVATIALFKLAGITLDIILIITIISATIDIIVILLLFWVLQPEIQGATDLLSKCWLFILSTLCATAAALLRLLLLP